MYDNLTKHKILFFMREFLVKNKYKSNYPFDFNKLREDCSIEEHCFGRCMTTLRNEKCLSISNFGNGTATVHLLPQGDALASDYFYKKQNHKEIFREVSTLIVGLATIITLIISIVELNEIKMKIPQIEQDIRILKQQLPIKEKGQNTDNHLRIYPTDTLNVKVSK